MASSLPIGSNRTIGKDIPPAKKILYCPMTDEEDDHVSLVSGLRLLLLLLSNTVLYVL